MRGRIDASAEPDWPSLAHAFDPALLSGLNSPRTAARAYYELGRALHRS